MKIKYYNGETCKQECFSLSEVMIYPKGFNVKNTKGDKIEALAAFLSSTLDLLHKKGLITKEEVLKLVEPFFYAPYYTNVEIEL